MKKCVRCDSQNIKKLGVVFVYFKEVTYQTDEWSPRELYHCYNCNAYMTPKHD